MNTLTVNDLRFEVRRSAQRRVLEITVDRGGELIMSAPPEVPDAKLREFAQRKRMWVYKQLAKKEASTHEVRGKQFTEGEGFAYLGRNYRLRLVPESDAAVKLVGGRFVMPKPLVRDGREHLIRWYCERAKPWLAGKVDEYAARMEVRPAGVRVQDLGYRWGSCGKGELLYFHWKTILLAASALLANSLDEALSLAHSVTVVTHDHPEGLRGALATAASIWWALQDMSAEDIRAQVSARFGYDLDTSVDAIRPTYRHSEAAQHSVPQALVCALEAVSYEDAVRNAVSIGGDSDTIAAIAGAVAEARFGLPEEIAAQAWSFLDRDMRCVLSTLYARTSRG